MVTKLEDNLYLNLFLNSSVDLTQCQRNIFYLLSNVNAFFTTVNQMFGCSSQRPNTAERAGIKSLLHSSVNETVLGSGRKPEGAAEDLIDGCENAFVD